MLKRKLFAVVVALVMAITTLPIQVFSNYLHRGSVVCDMCPDMSLQQVVPQRTVHIPQPVTRSSDPLHNLPPDHPLRFGPGVSIGLWTGTWVQVLVDGYPTWNWVDDYKFHFLHTFPDGEETLLVVPRHFPNEDMPPVDMLQHYYALAFFPTTLDRNYYLDFYSLPWYMWESFLVEHGLLEPYRPIIRPIIGGGIGSSVGLFGNIPFTMEDVSPSMSRMIRVRNSFINLHAEHPLFNTAMTFAANNMRGREINLRAVLAMDIIDDSISVFKTH